MCFLVHSRLSGQFSASEEQYRCSVVALVQVILAQHPKLYEASHLDAWLTAYHGTLAISDRLLFQV